MIILMELMILLMELMILLWKTSDSIVEGF